MPAEAAPDVIEGAAPGVAALLEGVSEDRSHAVLDLGAAAAPSLHVYSRFARWVRFADVLGYGRWPHADRSDDELQSIAPAPPERPYDLVFAWDILDRLHPDDRPRLAQRLAELTAPDARLHVIVRASAEAPAQPLRFVLLDVDRFSFEPADSAPLSGSRHLPAEVAKLLAPFHIVHAFTLKSGLREYVALRAPH